ncbi:MAG: hypothetical protein [Chaetfec virus UA24_144]|nr:MAG: hypothetical protein [Chaetfec virus UA24_144]
MSELYLQHYGVKGMKWGVRRYRKENGDLTAEGERRYSQKYKDKRNDLISQYEKNGYSHKEASIAADKRLKTQKLLKTAAGVSLVVAAAYLVGKNIQANTDQLIKAGDTLQRIEMENTGGKLHSSFYASINKKDNKRYATMLGATRQMQTGEAYIMKLAAKGDIKVASQKNAQKAFEKLYNSDKEFAKRVRDSMFIFGNPQELNKLSGKKSKQMYEAFNRSLVSPTVKGEGVDKKFFDYMKKQGYGAIQDVNDMKFSGYAAKNPLIIFEGANSKIVTESTKKMAQVSKSKAAIETAKASLEQNKIPLLGYVAIGSAVTAANMESQRKAGNVGKLAAKQQQKAEQLQKRGLTYKEIAQKLGVPEGTISSYLNG